MKIVINPYSESSIEKALSQIKSRKSTFESRVDLLCKELAGLGLNVAKANFASAEYDGNNDVVVSVEKTDAGYRIVARGNAVAFIEFGTGIALNPQGNSSYFGERPEGIASIGEYGKGKGATGKPWYYGSGHKSVGNVPAMAMYKAEQEMLLEVMQLARSILNV